MKLYLNYYLYEIKYYFIYNILLIGSILILNWYYFNELVYILLKPLFHNNFKISELNNNYLIFTGLTDILFIYIKIYIISILYCYIPIFFWQIIKFIKNGLYVYEYLLLKNFSFIFMIFFIINNLIIYFFFIPIIWEFFLNFEITSNLKLFNLFFEGKINDYVLLILKLLININICLNLPLILIILTYYNIFTLKFIIKQRKIFYFIFLVFSTLISPPELLSLFFIIILLYILYEFTILFIIILKNYKILR